MLKNYLNFVFKADLKILIILSKYLILQSYLPSEILTAHIGEVMWIILSHLYLYTPLSTASCCSLKSILINIVVTQCYILNITFLNNIELWSLNIICNGSLIKDRHNQIMSVWIIRKKCEKEPEGSSSAVNRIKSRSEGSSSTVGRIKSRSDQIAFVWVTGKRGKEPERSSFINDKSGAGLHLYQVRWTARENWRGCDSGPSTASIPNRDLWESLRLLMESVSTAVSDSILRDVSYPAYLSMPGVQSAQCSA